jgi:prepilin-type N-terminal cleavage/methylation domain-containing protein
MKKREQGFTLIEIAIVLVIIGLLLGGVLKGQELITGARVRNLIQQQDGVKAAYFGFMDRYRAMPGDYLNADTAIATGLINGDGDGQIEVANGTNNESVLVWAHLSRSGFINGSYTYNATINDTSNPRNPYGGPVELMHDGIYGAGTTGGTGAAAPNALRPNLKTGTRIPAQIIAEIDRKVDDGLPDAGVFQRSTHGTPDTACITTGTPNVWNAGGNAANCGGATLF